jgi:hypothetical protein
MSLIAEDVFKFEDVVVKIKFFLLLIWIAERRLIGEG